MSGLPIPVSKAVIDAHESLRRKIEAANLAVFEAARAIVVDYDDPIAANIFGCDAISLRALAGMSKVQILPLLMTGIPIWSLRLATPESKDALEINDGGNALLACLLSTFSKPVQLNSL